MKGVLMRSPFRVGDKCIVTGDTAREGHSFPPGETVTLIEQASSGDIWKAQGTADWWWVNVVDLKLVDPGPTDQEILAAFGLAAEPTDADYLRKLAVDERLPMDVRIEINDYLNVVRK
jgi:hypothetical protein